MTYKYKMVNGELIELTLNEIAELEERDRNPPREPGPPPNANERINRAMEAIYEALPPLPMDRSVRRSDEDVWEQVTGINNALREMVAGFRATDPRSELLSQRSKP